MQLYPSKGDPYVWGLKNLYTMLHIAVSTFKVPMGEDSSSLSTKDNVLADELRLYRRCPSCIRWSHFPIHQCTQNGTHNLTKSLQHFGKSEWNVYIFDPQPSIQIQFSHIVSLKDHAWVLKWHLHSTYSCIPQNISSIGPTISEKIAIKQKKHTDRLTEIILL